MKIETVLLILESVLLGATIILLLYSISPLMQVVLLAKNLWSREKMRLLSLMI